MVNTGVLVRALSIDAARLQNLDPVRVSFCAARAAPAQSGKWMRLAVAGGFPI
jgi:type IV pilus biogenesis protein CpaD/CtpE